MIDQERATKWAKEANIALMQHYGEGNIAGHLAAIVLALLTDRDDRERYCARVAETDSEDLRA